MPKLKMMELNDDIEMKLAKIVRECYYDKNHDCRLMEDKGLARVFPGGEDAYFKKRIFEIKEDITLSTMIGGAWATNNFINIFHKIEGFTWIKRMVYLQISHLGEESALYSFEIFMKKFCYLVKLEKEIDSFLTYEGLFKKKGECNRITNIIIEKACTNGIFTGFREAMPATTINQLKITYEIVKSHFLKANFTNRNGSKDESKQLFLKRFGWTGYRGKKPNEDNSLDISKPMKNTDLESVPNKNAFKEIELILMAE